MQHKKRKKIYSEQLLEIHEDSKKIHPGKEKFCAAHLSMPVIFLTPTVRNSL